MLWMLRCAVGIVAQPLLFGAVTVSLAVIVRASVFAPVASVIVSLAQALSLKILYIMTG